MCTCTCIYMYAGGHTLSMYLYMHLTLWVWLVLPWRCGLILSRRLWDIRRLVAPVFTMSGHTQSIKCVKFSPHHSSVVASCSYDFTVRIWDTQRSMEPLMETVDHHREFTYGVDFSIHEKGLVRYYRGGGGCFGFNVEN